MVSIELLNYVRSQIAKGVPEPAIIDELRSKQWEEPVIQEAMAELRQPMGDAVPTVMASEPIAQSEPSDMFTDGGATPAMPEEPVAPAMPVMSMPVAAEALPTTSGGGRSKLALIIGIVVAGLLVLGGGAAAAYFFWYQAPERVLAKTMENLSELQAVQFSATLTPELNGSDELALLDPDVESVSVIIAGRSNTLDDANPVSAVSATLNVTGSLGQQSYGIETRSVDSVVYLRPTTTILGPIDLSFLEDRWVKYDPAEVKEALGDVLPPEVLEAAEAQQDAELTVEEVAQVRQAFRDNIFVTVSAPTGEAEIYGTKTKGYPASVDAAKLATFLQNVRPIFERKGLQAEQVDEMITDVQATEFPTITLWISKEAQLYRVTGMLKPEDSETTINWTIDLWNHNQPFTLEAPTETIDLQDFVEELMTSMLGGAFDESTDVDTLPTLPVTDDADVVVLPVEEPAIAEPVDDTPVDDGTDTDGDGLTDLEESMYGTDPENEDSDGDTFVDGEEVENGYDPLGPGALTTAGGEERDEERVSELHALQNSLELYFADRDRYPAVGDDWQDLGDALSPYINSAQADPEHPDKTYTYFVSADGSEYVLRAVLEQTDVTELVLDLDGDVGGKGYDGVSSDDSFQQKKMSCDDPAYCLGS